MSELKDRKKKSSFFRRLFDKIRYGLILQVIRNQLAKIGIEITPYYWIQEGVNPAPVPEISGSFSDYTVEILKEEDMAKIEESSRGYTAAVLISRLREGNVCMGLKHNDDIATFFWAYLDRCRFVPVNIPLAKDEVYLADMYTMENYRGRNLATRLRYMGYDILRKMGREKIYSVTEYFNSSAMKYKQKLNPKPIRLVLYICLFRKFKRSFVLKTY
jgi:hypothetical protein